MTTRPRRPPRSTAAALSACGLLLASCAAVGPHGPPAATRVVPPGAAAVPPELRRYYEQSLRWEPCEDAAGFQCAMVRAPLDYDRPEAGDVLLTVARRKATGTDATRIGSLLYNPGGPGMSAVTGLANLADAFPPDVRAAYDLVAVDPRGVGDSSPVDCATDTPMTVSGSGVITSTVPADFDDAFAEYRDLAAACERHAGRLLPHVGTMDTARDMDVVRALLGDDRLNYLGHSYGTYLGATYAELFPSRVGRMVLDGAVDPSIDAYRTYLAQAHGYQVAWEGFAADCAARPDCPVGHSVAEANRALDTLVADLNNAPLRLGKDTTVTGDSLIDVVITALLAATWDDLREVLRLVITDDATALQPQDGGEEEDPGGEEDAGVALQSFLAVDCLSATRGPRLSAAQAEAALPEYLRASPQFGRAYATQLTRCASWPVQPNQFPHPITANGAAPILVVGTTRDPATPYDQARALAGQLASGRLLTYDGEGHGAYVIAGSTCVDTAVDRYLIDGRLPASGTVCA